MWYSLLVESVYVSLSDAFQDHCGLKQGDAPSPLLYNFALEYAVRRVHKKAE